MIKNRMAKIVGTAMAATLMLGAVPAYANETVEVAQEQNTVDMEQLGYAVEEMRVAIDLLDNANLVDRENYDAMVIFANTAVQRVQGMDQTNEYVQDILEKAGQITNVDSTILRRIMNDIDGLQNANEDTKEDWINALNEAITYARENGLLNEATVRAASEILHTAAGIN